MINSRIWRTFLTCSIHQYPFSSMTFGLNTCLLFFIRDWIFTYRAYSIFCNNFIKFTYWVFTWISRSTWDHKVITNLAWSIWPPSLSFFTNSLNTFVFFFISNSEWFTWSTKSRYLNLSSQTFIGLKYPFSFFLINHI